MLVEVEGPVGGYGPSYLLCHCHWQPEEVRSQRLTAILVHGLEGSSRSQYMLGNTARMLAAGLNVVRMNMRSAAVRIRFAPRFTIQGGRMMWGRWFGRLSRIRSWSRLPWLATQWEAILC